MKRSVCWSAVLLGATVLIWASPKGTAPRTSASSYRAHAEQNGVAIGASLLSPEETRKKFVSDMNRCCTIVEVALYPSQAGPLAVSLNDFTFRVKDADIGSKPSSAKVVAARLQRNASSDRDVTVSPSVGVGYGNDGYDRGGGVYQQVGVGVGVGRPGQKPGASDKDRDVMETELSEKGLPEGSTSAAVAGYVYFPISAKKNTTYQLEYILNNQKIVLTLP